MSEASQDLYRKQKGLKPTKRKNQLLEDIKALEEKELHPDFEPWEDPQDFNDNGVVR